MTTPPQRVRSRTAPWLAVVASAAFLAVNAGGFLLARAAVDVDGALKALDPKAIERVAENLDSNRDMLDSLFKLDVAKTVGDKGILVSQGEDLDIARVTDILERSIGDVDLTQGSAAELTRRVSSLSEQLDIQGTISKRASISSFQSAVVDMQTRRIMDKMQSVSASRDGVTKKWLDDLKSSDKASSMLNNLAPL